MSQPAIKVENLSKQYKLGLTHTDLLSERLGNGIRALASILSRKAYEPAGVERTVSQQDEFIWALKDINFEIGQGEVIGIIGRNGAGKSTLLKILSKITSPTTGRIELNGRVASLLEVGTGFHPELTGRENIFLNGAILGMSRKEIKAKFDEIIAFAEVEKFIDTPVKRYSSGMYVRLAFSVAAYLEPEILLVDEVLAVGDAAFQKKCLGKMEDVAQGGRTVFFVSHNMASIKKLCSTVIYLQNGMLIGQGSSNAIVSDYLRDNLTETSSTCIPEYLHKVKSHLQIKKLELINSKGQLVTVFECGEPFTLRLIVDVKEPLTDIRIGIGLVAEGIRIATVHTPAIDITDKTGSYIVDCKFPGNVLLPNFYSVQLGAHKADTGRGLDWIPDASVFQILNVSADEEKLVDEKELGLIRLEPDWNWSNEKSL